MSDPISPKSSFLKSALTVENPFLSTADVRAWLGEIGRTTRFEVERIPFDQLEKWAFDPDTGDLAHESGKFFRIEGVHVRTNCGPVEEWEQPIINQPEIGILGIITRVIDGVRYFLMQAKLEPGNVIPAQLAPTVQATKSNFTQVHQGKLPPFLDYFLDRSVARILVDQLQSEQGARFLRKRNRNMILEIDEELPAPDGFCWVTLGQIKELMKSDDLINMDARSVISCIPFIDRALTRDMDSATREQLEAQRPFDHDLEGFGRDVYLSMRDEFRSALTMDELISWFTGLKSARHLETRHRPLKNLDGWVTGPDDIHHVSGNFFSVIAVRADIGGREVARWTQPLVAHPRTGLIGFLAQRINGVLHFLVHAHTEPGVFDLMEMSPTVIASDPQRNKERPGAVPFLERFLDAPPEQIRFDAIQSEEGGRFFQVRNRNMIVELPPEEELALPEEYTWMTLRQIIDFTRHNNYFNVEARGLLACSSFL